MVRCRAIRASAYHASLSCVSDGAHGVLTLCWPCLAQAAWDIQRQASLEMSQARDILAACKGHVSSSAAEQSSSIHPRSTVSKHGAWMVAAAGQALGAVQAPLLQARSLRQASCLPVSTCGSLRCSQHLMMQLREKMQRWSWAR